MKIERLYTPQSPPTTTTFKKTLPSSIAQGGVSVEKLSSGMQLMVVDFNIKQSIRVKRGSSGCFVGFGFCLKNSYKSKVDCYDELKTAKSGESGFFYFPKPTCWTIEADCGEMLNMFVMMDTKTLHEFVSDDESCFPILERIESDNPCIIPDIITPAMNMVLRQIAACPYTGAPRRLYMEGKAVELLALKLDRLRFNNHSFRKTASLKPADIERIRHAADVLVKDLENPPDLVELARSVELSRSKLHRCFHQVYGISPFEFLRKHRLQTAMNLLKEGEFNVTETAFSVGYANLSHFAKAFKSMFGVLPGEVLNHTIPAMDPLKRLRL